MGLTQIRNLHLPRMRGSAPRARSTHFVRAQYYNGRVQGRRNSANGLGWEHGMESVLGREGEQEESRRAKVGGYPSRGAVRWRCG